MATFELEDWVEVSEQVNKRSILWQDGNEIFCGKICKVIGVGEDPDTGMPFLQLSYKGNRAWFSSDSVIKSTKYDEERQEWWNQKAKELQEWEEKKKKSTDDMLKKMFGLKKEPSDTEGFFNDPSNYLDGYEYDYENDTDVSEDAADNWEEATDPCLLIPTKAALNPSTVNNIKSGLSVMTDEELEELIASISGMMPEEQD
tara:strand:- start:104 stop:706 length:603 start_codon:yes stop_codon:yes gene_type:complete